MQVGSIAPPPDFPGAAVTVTVTDWAAEPPGPVQVKVKVSVAATATAKLSLVILVPVQPEPPLAVQVMAFLLLQVSVTAPPAVTEVALDVNVTVGGDDETLSAYKPKFGTIDAEALWVFGLATKVSTYFAPGVPVKGKVPPP